MTQLVASPTTNHQTQRWTRLARATGVAGLAAVVLIFTPIIALSTQGEPAITASAEQAHAFFADAGDAGWRDLATAAMALAALTMVWFVAGLGLLLARAEGSPPWRALAALVSGLLLPAYLLLDVAWDAAVNRAADIDPGLAAYAFDAGNLGFANIWVAMGSFALATGWVVLSTRVLGRWLGWWAIFSGGGLVLCRFVWTSEIWLAPYSLFWIWMIVVCVVLIRRGGRADSS